MLTVDFVKNAIEENEFGETRITCPDGQVATVVPCFEGFSARIENVEYFLIYWDMPWGGEDTLEKLVNTLNRHAELAQENDAEEQRLHAYFDRHQKEGWDDDSLEWFSDWHKDVFGYRPRGMAFGEVMR